MSKREFLLKLKEYLSYELPESMIRGKIDFYSEYIDREAANGRGVQEVLEDLGDPQLIARSIIDAEKSGPDGVPGSADDRDFSREMYGNAGTNAYSGGTYGDGSAFGGAGSGTVRGAEETGTDPYGGIKVYQFGCFTAVLILLILFSVLSFIGALLGAASPILAPVCMVMLIVWLLGRARGGGW
jgi:uncharacterized membrane protein